MQKVEEEIQDILMTYVREEIPPKKDDYKTKLCRFKFSMQMQNWPSDPRDMCPLASAWDCP